MKKRLIFYVHSAAGLISGLFILLMSLSGAALVFHDELDAAQLPPVITNDQKILTVDRCYRIVQEKYPAAQVSHCMLPGDKNKPFSFFIYDSSHKNGTKALQVLIHPQNGSILKTRGGSDDAANNLMSWLSAFHNSLHLGKTGEWLLGVFAIVFLLSILTGLVLFRKSIAGVLLFRKGIYRKNNLHQLIGVYALLFNLMIGVTGFWMQRYVFKKEFYSSSDYKPVLKTSPGLFFGFDSAYTALQKQHPDFTGSVIYFAQSKKGKTAIYGSRSSNAFIHSKKYADVILLDSSGSLASTRFVTEISADDRYDIINSQLHMGKFGGLGIQLIYFFFGLTGAFLSITGSLLWYKRKKQSS
jgi:uncharacterized iron-regulated membrane protein